MEEIYTENALVRYVYRESDLFERLEVEYALENDPQLFQLYLRLKKAKDNFTSLAYLPSESSRQKILDYSAGFAVRI